MKKILALLLAVAVMGACSTVNKNTLSYRLSKVNGEKFITGVGNGATKAEAEQKAKEDIKKIFDGSNAADMPVVADIYNHAFIEKTWKDKKTKTYYSIAALERQVAKDMLKNSLTSLDLQISGLVSKYKLTQDKFAKIKTSLKIQPLIIRRNALEDLHEKIDYNGQGYDPQNFASLKNIVYESMNEVKISLNVLGKNSEILHTHIINSLNQMGLSVAINEAADIAVDVNSEITEYPSKKVEGLMWCSATATVGLKDVATGGVFARFSISGRQGSSRSEEAVKRTMDDIGKSSAEEISKRMYDYLERR
ncbi:hypothetical protein AAIR98_000485 [Elusimicrobium simillimum]|uniref:hypothetical protein n=1 Tax=Elusimicrobium simillimum TaxID=3143438 RepID=UPI003C6EE5B3